MAAAVPRRRVAILAYGSLLYAPGPDLAAAIVERRPCVTPFGVEYGRASVRWGGGPVLVPHRDGAAVDGTLLLLGREIDLGTAVDLLAAREGLPSARGVQQVAMDGDHVVLTACLPRNLMGADMRPAALARRAVASASNGPRNGVAYLRAAVAAGIRTPLTPAYAERVLALAGARTLEEAEERLVASGPVSRGDAHGLG